MADSLSCQGVNAQLAAGFPPEVLTVVIDKLQNSLWFRKLWGFFAFVFVFNYKSYDRTKVFGVGVSCMFKAIKQFPTTEYRTYCERTIIRS